MSSLRPFGKRQKLLDEVAVPRCVHANLDLTRLEQPGDRARPVHLRRLTLSGMMGSVEVCFTSSMSAMPFDDDSHHTRAGCHLSYISKRVCFSR
jgi:hypothetical protein